jgi:hypothetical protein
MIKNIAFKRRHLRKMPAWISNLAITVVTLITTMTVTLLYNKIIGLPKAIKKQKEEEMKKEAQLAKENKERDNKIAELQAAVDALPGYRQQSLQIQTQLQNADKDILDACKAIQDGVKENQKILNFRLDRLEKREKNALRAKLLNEYRLFTDETKNPLLAWSEMEHHAFFELVRDYEDLGGNDYVHSTVIPAVNELDVIAMTDKEALLRLMNSRKL